MDLKADPFTAEPRKIVSNYLFQMVISVIFKIVIIVRIGQIPLVIGMIFFTVQFSFGFLHTI